MGRAKISERYLIFRVKDVIMDVPEAVYAEGRIQGEKSTVKKTTLLLMAAGLGSRYGGNKQIDGIGPHGEILMQYSIYDAIRAGFDRVVLVIKPEHREVVERLCGAIRGIELDYVYQDFSNIPEFYRIPEERVKPFGTVHAVLCAADTVKEPFAVLNADDFYGADAFRVLHDRLIMLEQGEAAMMAYYLKNTVSLNGGVTRGICRVSERRLEKVTETYRITVDRENRICDGEGALLDGNCLTSMNLWGFRPEIFPMLRASFEEFLHGIPEGELKAEYALPTFVDRMIGNGALSVDVLSTDSVWFGVTYREDREGVRQKLAAMHAAGIYPEKLF